MTLFIFHDTISLQKKGRTIMKKAEEYSLPRTTKANLNQIINKVSNLSDDQLKQANVKEWSMNQLFSNDHLVNVLRELSKV